jgi:RNA polymerase sigma-70 factor (ECF subfamily)
MDRNPADEALMLAYRAGDAASFDTLYSRHKGAVFRYLRRQVRSMAVAEELFQDVWMKLIDARAGYEPRAKFTTWLYTIAHHRLMDHFRGAARAILVSYDETDDPPEDVASAAPAPDELFERKQQAAGLLAAIEALPSAQREAFLLQQEADLSLDEIALVTGTNRETVKSRLRYAMAKLRAQLAESADRNPRMQGV